MLLTIAAAIVVLGVLIFVHELGHFMAAKAVGIGVPRFSIGLGPIIKPLSFTRGETEYVISWVPFGGYVKMATAEEADGAASLEGGEMPEDYPPEKLFENKPLWARILVITAGVIMNVLFAWFVYLSLAMTYGNVRESVTSIGPVDAEQLPAGAEALAELPVGATVLRVNGDTVTSWRGFLREVAFGAGDDVRIDFAGGLGTIVLPFDEFATEERSQVVDALQAHWEARVDSLTPGGPAEQAGFQRGDLVIRVDADTVLGWIQLATAIQAAPNRTMTFDVVRAGEIVTLEATPGDTVLVDAATGEERAVGLLGFSRASTVRRIRYGLGTASVDAVRRVGDNAELILRALRGLIFGEISPRELGGPVLIGQISGQTARLGFEAFLSFMALFSVNLAILNILPIPVLDGGHLAFLLIEGIQGKPLSVGVRLRLSQIGLVVLLGIMGLALTNDILRVFGL